MHKPLLGQHGKPRNLAGWIAQATKNNCGEVRDAYACRTAWEEAVARSGPGRSVVRESCLAPVWPQRPPDGCATA
jgi:hypothetical protein